MGVSPITNLMEVKVSKAQGHRREAGSEVSVKQRYELMYKNWIRGIEVGQVGGQPRSPYPSKTKGVYPAVVYRRLFALPREISSVVGITPTGQAERFVIAGEKSAEGIVGGETSRIIRRSHSIEGPNITEWLVGG